MLRSILFFGFLAALTAAMSPAQAQQQPEERALFVCFAYYPETPKWYFRNLRGDFEELKASTSGFYSRNMVPVSDQIRFYKDGVDDFGNEIKVEAGSVTLPEGFSPVRLLFYITSDGKIRSKIMNDTPELHPKMGVRVVNLHDEPVGVMFAEDQRGIVQAGADQVFQPVDTTGEPFFFKYFKKTDTGKPFESSSIRLRFSIPEQRYTIFLVYRPQYGFTELPEDSEEVPERVLAGLKGDRLIVVDRAPPWDDDDQS